MAAYDITKLGSAFEYDTTAADSSSVIQLSSTRILAVWVRNNFLQVGCFDINRSTGSISAVGSNTYPAYSCQGQVKAVYVSATRAGVFFSQSSDAYIGLIAIDGSGNTSEIMNTAVSTDNEESVDAVMMDSTHCLYVLCAGGQAMSARIAEYDSGADQWTLLGSDFSVNASGEGGALAKISGSKALLTYRDSTADGFARVLDVNTSTWAVTGAASAFEFYDSTTLQGMLSVTIVDFNSSPIVAFVLYKATTGSTTGIILQGLNINSSTWAVTNFAGTVRQQIENYTTNSNQTNRTISTVGDNQHIVVFYEGIGADGYVETFSTNNSTGAVTLIDSEIYDTTLANYVTEGDLLSGLFVGLWSGSGNDGFMQLMQVEVPTLSGVKTINGLAIASVKTIDGLAKGSTKSWNGVT